MPNNKERKTSDEAKAIQKYDEIIHQTNLNDKAGVEKYSNPEKRVEYITKRRKKELKPKFEKFLLWLKQIATRNKEKCAMNRAI